MQNVSLTGRNTGSEWPLRIWHLTELIVNSSISKPHLISSSSLRDRPILFLFMPAPGQTAGQGIISRSVPSSFRQLPNLWTRYFENELEPILMKTGTCSAGKSMKRSTLGVRRSKVKVTRGRDFRHSRVVSYLQRPRYFHGTKHSISSRCACKVFLRKTSSGSIDY